MSPKRNDSRLPLNCKFCNKVFRKLTQHLNLKCMKGASKDDIMSVRDAARKAAYEHLEKGMVVDYRHLEGLLSLPEDRLKVVSWLEEHEHIIKNKKSLPVVAPRVKEAQQNETPEPSEEQSMETAASETEMDTDMMTEQESPPYQPHTTLTSESLTLAECVEVLTVAEPRFLKIFVSATSDCPLSTKDCLHYLYYLEALLMLKHMQRPAVVKNMTVEEWCIRKKMKTNAAKYFLIGVKEQKMGAPAVATIFLDQQEEGWMDVYYTKIRPELLKNCDPDKEEAEDKFFISSTGSPIDNPLNDLSKFQRK
ncbi:hypothetical protein UPYG_G00060910 [Umbra pygmaea]|uniref:Uncharacterized protein n=1 Tax=Umbra pygmaea TaxID=75934 RepID=A0ABD0X9B2_UMBPY